VKKNTKKTVKKNTGTDENVSGIGAPNALDKDEPVCRDKECSPLSVEQQEQLLLMLQRGASPSVACHQSGVSPAAFLKSFSDDEHVREEYRSVLVLLSQNVLAALYREALEGSVSAQSFWLKSCPPPGWMMESRESENRSYLLDEAMNELTDDELLDLARAMELDVPPATETKVPAASGAEVSQGVS